MKYIIFFLIALSVSGIFHLQSASANHYSDLGMDDTWYWREYDQDIDQVDCLYTGDGFLSDDGVDNIQFILNDDGIDEEGFCLFIKTFLISNIENVGGSNTFNLRFENNCDAGTCFYTTMSVLDGNYQQYYDYSDSSIFPDDYVGGGTWEAGALDSGSWGDLESTSGGVKTNLNCANTSTVGTQTLTCTIDTTEWGRSTTNYVSVIFWVGRGGGSNADGNFVFQPESFWITSTPNGTLTWNWPETAGELANWDLYSISELQLNGTDHDYGYFITYDESVPDPPTDLIAQEDVSDIDLDWEAPLFNGYSPITGYKIERESPIGNGFATIVPNTFSTATQYQDTSVTIGNEYNYRVRAINSHGESAPSNESKDGVGSITDPTPDVDCTGELVDFILYGPSITQDSVTLCWNGGILPQGNLLGYQINSTTPWGDPQTVFLNNTGTQETTRLIPDLEPATQYSFRVQSWQNGSANNVTQILNITTLPSGFDLPDYRFDGRTNPFKWDWNFVQSDLGNNMTSLLVNYDSSINATCVFDFRFANTQKEYSNLSTTSLGNGRVYANFTLQDPGSEVIYVTCHDENNPDSEGRTIIYQTTYPLLEQIQGFRAGDYGTAGNFGVFDLITLIIVIISMVGFNRINSAVGAVFATVVIFAAGFFGFIAPFSAILMGLVIAVVGIAIFMHHRNDING